ncbi:MAG: ATP-binding protein [Paludibacteraceae bacterium]|nr:ATP-binding protein [Paludibacteraceae bacterium]
MKNKTKILLFLGCIPSFVIFTALLVLSVRYIRTQSMTYEDFIETVGECAQLYDTEVIINTRADDVTADESFPLLVTKEIANTAAKQYFARLLPIYALAFLISVIFPFVLIRILTKPYNDLYHQMQELEVSSQRQAKAERESAWRTMARQIAHEINNPLTPMKLTIQQLQRVKGSERFDALFDRSAPMLVEQIDNLSRIASSFSAFVQMPQVEGAVTDVAAKLTDAIALCRNNDAHIPIRYIGLEKGVEAYADRNQIGQVFTNLMNNAIQVLQDKPNGDILVVLKQLEHEIEISISDNGPGIQDDLQDKIFTPYFTTKKTGTGLGLVISKNIVECTGGRICFQTSKNGTTFFVYLKKK